MTSQSDDPTNWAIKDEEIQEPTLELPPQSPVSPALSQVLNSGINLTSGDNSSQVLAQFQAKASALDTFIVLLCKDLGFTDFCRELLLNLLTLVPSEAGSLLEFDAKDGMLHFRAAVGQASDRITDFSIPIGKGIVGSVAESKQVLNIKDVKTEAKHYSSISNAVSFEAKNLICIPVLVRGKLFGVVELLNRAQAPFFSSEDQELLVYLVGMAARVIEVRLMLSWALQKSKAA